MKDCARKIGGVPVLSLKGRAPTLETPSAVSKALAEEMTKLRSEVMKGSLHRLKAATGAEDSDSVEKKKNRKRKAKGPHPMSVRRKKKKPNPESNQTNTRNRKRHRRQSKQENDIATQIKKVFST